VPHGRAGYVVVADGTLAGVVDFGDVFAGDPAWDLAAAWVLLPAGGAARFSGSYAQADEAAIRRAGAGRAEEAVPDACRCSGL
jgi:aminoglycoside phosphotransferase (APT) family kinase protein